MERKKWMIKWKSKWKRKVILFESFRDFDPENMDEEQLAAYYAMHGMALIVISLSFI